MKIRDNEKVFVRPVLNDTQFIYFLKINSLFMAHCVIIDLFIQ